MRKPSDITRFSFARIFNAFAWVFVAFAIVFIALGEYGHAVFDIAVAWLNWCMAKIEH